MHLSQQSSHYDDERMSEKQEIICSESRQKQLKSRMIIDQNTNTKSNNRAINCFHEFLQLYMVRGFVYLLGVM
jgi:hypothetical protein